MTHKSFYEAAVAEVAAGHIDGALWIKICADMPEAESGSRQARYIQLRAEELAVSNAKNKVQEFANTAKWRTARTLRALLIIFIVLVALFAFVLWPLITAYDIKSNQSELNKLTKELQASGAAPNRSANAALRCAQWLVENCQNSQNAAQDSANTRRLILANGISRSCRNLYWVRENRFEGMIVLSLVGASPLYKIWCEVPQEHWPVKVQG